MQLKISLIITTYNSPDLLQGVLNSVLRLSRMPEEVVIADDGSGNETKELIDGYRENFPCSLVHVWHEDKGYRVAAIRNKAVSQASGNYIVFIDGDCLLRPDFIAQHARLARPNHFVAGNRAMLTEEYSKHILREKIDITHLNAFDHDSKSFNRRWSLLRLPMGIFRHFKSGSWKGVKGCNISMFTKDFEECNGHDESFEGWGYEDSELVVRLLNKGLRRISGRFAVTVIHLWHSTNKGKERSLNWNRLQKSIQSKRVKTEQGLNAHR